MYNSKYLSEFTELVICLDSVNNTSDIKIGKETNMARHYNHNQSPLIKIVYSKIIFKGKIELVPMELYADGSLKKG